MKTLNDKSLYALKNVKFLFATILLMLTFVFGFLFGSSLTESLSNMNILFPAERGSVQVKETKLDKSLKPTKTTEPV